MKINLAKKVLLTYCHIAVEKSFNSKMYNFLKFKTTQQKLDATV